MTEEEKRKLEEQRKIEDNEKAGIDTDRAKKFEKGFGTSPLGEGIMKAFKDLVGHNTVTKPRRRG